MSFLNLNCSLPSQVSNHFFTNAVDFNNFIYNYETGFKILQINVRSMVSMKKFDLFNSFLLSLACDLDIIIIGETWLNYDIIFYTI